MSELRADGNIRVEQLCRVCGVRCEMNSYELHEVMFRTLESFRYSLCSKCESMQIDQIPPDLGKFYPEDYYSIGGTRGSKLVRWIRSQGLRFCAGERSWIGRLLAVFNRLPSDSIWMKACRPRLNWRILDVGCGAGDRLSEMALAGFTRLNGIDPYIRTDISVAPGVTVTRGTLDSLSGDFDFIMMHHSLEHVEDPRATIRHVARLLAVGGTILLRVPVMGKFAWRTWGVDWAQLDAPRHLYDFTEMGIAALAESAGLEVQSVVYDSFWFQFKGSEAARHLRAGQKERLSFSRKQMRHFREKADELNLLCDGDQACFILSRRRDEPPVCG